MFLMSLPAVFRPLASVLAALVAVIGGLTLAKRRPNLPTYHDCEREIADITLKVRSPWRYRAQLVSRWMDGK